MTLLFEREVYFHTFLHNLIFQHGVYVIVSEVLHLRRFQDFMVLFASIFVVDNVLREYCLDGYYLWLLLKLLDAIPNKVDSFFIHNNEN